MDEPKVWKASRDREISNASSESPSFEIAHTQLGHLKLVGFEAAVEQIVRRVLDKELTQAIQRPKIYPQIVCWTCRKHGHYSRDCKFNQRN